MEVAAQLNPAATPNTDSQVLPQESGEPEVITEETETEVPTEVVTEEPTEVETEVATDEPTEVGTEVPTEDPTEVPTEVATDEPVEAATEAPTEAVNETEESTDVVPTLTNLSVEPSQVEVSAVTIYVTTTDTTAFPLLPDGASWTVSGEGTDSVTDTFAEEHRTLPATIQVTNPVPYGEYTVTVDAEPYFSQFNATFDVDSETETFSVLLQPNYVSDVTIDVVSADPNVADMLPADASWTVSFGPAPVASDTFDEGHLQLPAPITVNNPVPFGNYDVTIDAGPNFEPYTGQMVVNQQQQTFTVTLVPVEAGAVTINVTSADPSIADMLPADASWSVSVDGTVIAGDTFAAGHLELPAEIAVNDLVPFGTYDVSVEAGPDFEPYAATFTINAQTQSLEVVLQPVTVSEVTINVLSANPSIADELPADATWSVSVDGDVIAGDTFAEGHLQLPAEIRVNDLVPFGEYSLSIDAGPAFHPYTQTVNVSQLTSEFDVVLTPASTSMVSLEVFSAYPDHPTRGHALPEGSTWEVTVDGEVIASDTFAAEHLTLPATIEVGRSVPYGTYTVTVNAAPEFLPFEATFVVNEAAHKFDVAIAPDLGLWPLQSTNEANIDNGEPHVIQIPSETCGTVTLQYVNPASPLAFFEARVDGEPATTTYGPHWVVPNDVMYGGENLYPGDIVTKVFEGEVVEVRFALGNPGPAFFDWTSFYSDPCPIEGVNVQLTSADSDIANALPEGSSWTISMGDEELTGEFDQDHLTLPVTISVSNPVPVGTYDIEIEAWPAFHDYTGQITVNAESSSFGIELVPVEASTVTLTVESADAGIANEVPAGTTWTISDGDGVVDSGTIETATTLPITAPLTNLVPFGDYTLTVENAEPVFEDYEQTFSINAQQQSITVALEPVEAGAVTINVTSADPSIANTLPADASWTVSVNGTAIAGDTFAEGHLELPAEIEVNDLVPFGTYDVAIEAGPNFAPYTGQLVVDQQTHEFEIELTPNASDVTINISSAYAPISTMPEDASWTVSRDGVDVTEEFDSEDLELPTEIAVNNPVPYGTYTITVEAGPVFHTYTATITVDAPETNVDIVLVPSQLSTVKLNVTSADPAIANTLPEDASWSLSLFNFPITGGTLAEGQAELPLEVSVEGTVPAGFYLVTVDAGPTFEPFTTYAMVNAASEAIDVELVPVTVSNVTIEVSSTQPTIANEIPAGTTWTISDGDGVVDSGTIETATTLPVTAPLTNLVPFGEYTLNVENAEPVFEDYTGTFNVNTTTQSFAVELEPVEAGAVTINVTSTDPSIANALPADATWSVSVDGNVIADDTFDGDHLELPSAIVVSDLVPFGTYEVTINAAPNFDPYTETFVVDGQTETFAVELEPMEAGAVTINVMSANPSIADELPADASWTVSVNGTVIASDTFAGDHLELPSEIVVNNLVPFGTYDVEIEAGPEFAPYTGQLVVDQQTQEFEIVLKPVTVSAVTINVTSANPSIADALPADATWSVSVDGEVIAGDTFAEGHLELPVTIVVNDPVPFGTYEVTIDAAPNFGPYTETFVVDSLNESIAVELEPVEAGAVTINVASANPSIADALPADATWSVSVDGEVIAGDTFAEGHLELPATIVVNDLVPFGTYEVTIDAAPNFAPYTESFEVDSQTETFAVELVPVEASTVTLTVESADAGIANEVPAGTTWTISDEDGVVDSGTIETATTLPVTAPLTNLVPFGEYTLTVSNAGPVFEDYSETFTINAQQQSITVALEPVEAGAVTINVMSGAPAIADELPAGATWSVSVDGEVIASDTFDGDHLQLPAEIEVNNLVPFGTYDVAIEAGPEFAPYSGQLVVNQQTQEFEIVLQPVTVSAVTINVTSANPSIADALPADATWSVSVDGEVIASDTFAEGHLELPATIAVNDLVPFGTYEVTIDAAPNFGPYTETFVVDSLSETIAVELEPLEVSTVTLTVESADADIANVLPTGTTLTISNEDGVVDTGTVVAPTTLPISGPLKNMYPFGEYTVTVENADPNFGPYTETFVVDSQTETFAVILDPVEAGAVTINVTSTDPSIADELPADATWIVSVDGAVLDGGTFAEGHLELPATIEVNDLVPFGSYDVTIEAGPNFAPYTETFEVDSQTETFAVELVPVEASTVTLTAESADADIANEVPAGTTWTISDGDGVVDSGTIETATSLPVTATLTNLVPFGDYTLTVENAEPVFQDYEQTFSINAQQQSITVALEPVEAGAVTINVTSADPSIADELPADASWSVSVDGTVIASDTFAEEDLELPTTIVVSDLVPFGTYDVTITAGPSFEDYTESFTVNAQAHKFDVELQPVEPTVDPEFTSSESVVAPGQIVRVAGTGFEPNEVVDITWMTTDGRLLGYRTADENGAFTGRITIPFAATSGDFELHAKGRTSGDTAATSVEVAQPSLNLVTGNAKPGTVVRLSGTGFPVNTIVDIRWGSETGRVIGYRTTSDQGAFTGAITVPATATHGEYTIWATSRSTTGGTRSATANLMVVGPHVVLNTATAPKGTVVRVSMNNFEPGERVDIRWESNDGRLLGWRVVGTNGSATGAITIPANATAGEYRIVVIGRDSGLQATADIAVTGPLVTVVPVDSRPGAIVTVRATGYQPGEVVDIFWGSSSGRLIGYRTADSNGAIVGKVTIPTTASDGVYHLVVQGRDSDAYGTGQVTITSARLP